MSARYQTITGTTSSISAGGTLSVNTTGIPSCCNIVKVEVTPDAPGGTFDYQIYKADTFVAGKLLAFWDNVAAALYYPIDDSSGVAEEALEGPPIPYDDDDNTGEFHHFFRNNDGSSHTYDWAIEYEEAPKFDASGNATFRAAVIGTTGSFAILGDVAQAVRVRTSLATPGSLADGDWWVEASGVSPARVVSIKCQDGGSTRTIASITY